VDSYSSCRILKDAILKSRACKHNDESALVSHFSQLVSLGRKV